MTLEKKAGCRLFSILKNSPKKGRQPASFRRGFFRKKAAAPRTAPELLGMGRSASQPGRYPEPTDSIGGPMPGGMTQNVRYSCKIGKINIRSFPVPFSYFPGFIQVLPLCKIRMIHANVSEWSRVFWKIADFLRRGHGGSSLQGAGHETILQDSCPAPMIISMSLRTTKGAWRAATRRSSPKLRRI